MTWAMTIVAGSTTLNLNDGTNYVLKEFTPVANGEELRTGDTIKIVVKGANQAAIGTNINAIQQVLWQAKYFQDTVFVNRVFLTFTPDGYATSYRSQIYTGEISYDERALAWEYWTKNLQVPVTITIERDNFWDGAVTAVTLTNVNGSGTSMNVYNCNDKTGSVPNKLTNCVYFSFAPSGADLPCPTKVLFTGSAGTTIRNVQIGMIANFYAAGYPDSYLFYDQSGTVDANCSGGAYKACTWSGTSESALITQGVSRNLLYFPGYFRVMARLRDATGYTDLYMRARLQSAAGVTLGESTYQLIPSNRLMVDLGVLRLAPLGYDPGTATANLIIYAKRGTADTDVVNVDYLQLVPLDGYRKFGEDIAVGSGDTLADDVTGNLYAYATVGATSQTQTGLITYGQSLLLQPGFNHYLVFSFDCTDNTAPVNRSLAFALSYRPRRRAL